MKEEIEDIIERLTDISEAIDSVSEIMDSNSYLTNELFKVLSAEADINGVISFMRWKFKII